MPVVYVSGVLRHPNGKEWAGGIVTVSLNTLFATADETVPTDSKDYRADKNGNVKIPVFVPSTGTAPYTFTAPDGASVVANLGNSGNVDLEELFANGGGAPTDIDTTLALILARLAPAFVALTDAATVAWDFEGYPLRNATVTLEGNRTLSIANVPNGGAGVLIVKQDAVGGRTLALPANSLVIEDGQGAVTLSSAANAIDILSFVYDGSAFYWTYGTNWTGA